MRYASQNHGHSFVKQGFYRHPAVGAEVMYIWYHSYLELVAPAVITFAAQPGQVSQIRFCALYYPYFFVDMIDEYFYLLPVHPVPIVQLDE